jgi:hypothetical protein
MEYCRGGILLYFLVGWGEMGFTKNKATSVSCGWCGGVMCWLLCYSSTLNPGSGSQSMTVPAQHHQREREKDCTRIEW